MIPAQPERPGRPLAEHGVCSPAPGSLALWEFAGLLVTYWCNARCAFCYVYSAPDRGGSMSVNDAVAMWRSLDRLAAAADKTMRIHLAGGEPFHDWPRLVSIIRAARDAGLTPLEKVETNAYWATHDGLTRARLELLDALGLEKLVISTDVYHQEFIPFDRVERCVRIARQVLGRGRVRVRWWDFLQNPVDVQRMSANEKLAAYRAALDCHKDRLTGRAAEQLATLLLCYPAEHFRGQRCGSEVLQSRHVHIDPYGHVFPGVCSGIILGTVAAGASQPTRRDVNQSRGREPVEESDQQLALSASVAAAVPAPSAAAAAAMPAPSAGVSETIPLPSREGPGEGRIPVTGSMSLPASPIGKGNPLAPRTNAHPSVEVLWHHLAANWRSHPVVDAVVAAGSYELMQRAKAFGYVERPGGYANKCHLCSHVRQFLVDRGIWPEFVGPPECYAMHRDRRLNRDADKNRDREQSRDREGADGASEPRPSGSEWRGMATPAWPCLRRGRCMPTRAWGMPHDRRFRAATVRERTSLPRTGPRARPHRRIASGRRQTRNELGPLAR